MSKRRCGAIPRVLLSALVVCVLGACLQTTPAQTDKATDELETLKAILTKPETPPSSRCDIAEILLKKSVPRADQILVDALDAAAIPEVRIAVLSAIANQSRPNPLFLEKIFPLLDSDNSALRGAAASALAAYDYLPEHMNRLASIAADAKSPLAKRLSAIESLGQTTYKPAVGTLIKLLKSDEPQVRSQSAKALEGITAIDYLGDSAAAWQSWWRQHQDMSAEEFLRRVVRRRRQQYYQKQLKVNLLAGRLVELLSDLYAGLTPEQKVPLVVKQLDDYLPEVRVLAANQAAEVAKDFISKNNGKLPNEVLMGLLAHIADPEENVRSAVADALGATENPKAAEELLKRLTVESNVLVKGRVALALGTLRHGQAVPTLIELLNAEHDYLVVQAARALGLLGEEGSPAKEAVLPAVKPLENLFHSDPKRSDTVREAGCGAIAKIAHPDSKPALLAALDDPAAGVRTNAVLGLGNLGPADQKTEDALLKRITDTNKAVRTAAADTLSRVGSQKAAQTLADRLFEETEQDVQKTIWDAICRLAESAPAPVVAEGLSSKFIKKDEPENQRRAAALIEIALKKYPPDASAEHACMLKEKLVSAYKNAGMPLKAVPILRDLLARTPEGNVRTAYTLELGLILLTAEPRTEGVKELAGILDKLEPAEREATLKKIFELAKSLSTEGKLRQAYDVLATLRAAKPQWDGKDWAEKFQELDNEIITALVKQSLAALEANDEKVRKDAAETLRLLGRPALPLLLDALQQAAADGKKDLETRLFDFLKTEYQDVFGYDPSAPLEKKKDAIRRWRDSIGPVPKNPN